MNCRTDENGLFCCSGNGVSEEERGHNGLNTGSTQKNNAVEMNNLNNDADDST